MDKKTKETAKSPKIPTTELAKSNTPVETSVDTALPASELKYRTVFDNAGDAIIIHDLNGNILDVNQIACDRLGFTREELLRMTPMDFDSPEYAKLVPERIRQIMTNKHIIFETCHISKDGNRISAENSSRFIEYDGKQAILSICRDITERKQAETELRLHSEILGNMAEGVFLIRTGKGGIFYENKKIERMFLYDSGELVGKHVSIVNAPCEKSPEETAEEIMQGLNAYGVWQGEVLSIRKDGTTFWCNKNITTFEHSQYGKVWISINHDITKRKLMEAALRQSEEKFRTLFESAIDALIIFDMEGDFIDINKTAYERLGYTKAEMLSMNISQLDHPDFADKIPERMEHLQKDGRCECESAHLRKDGTAMPVEINARFMDFQGRKVIFGIVRDISERKLLEEALHESEERLRQAIRVSQIGIFDHNHLTDSIYWSPRQREIHGWGPDEAVTLPDFLNLVHAEDIESISAAVLRAHDPAGDGVWDVEHRIIRRDATLRWLMARSQTFFEGESGERHPVRTIGAVLDITEQKQMEEHLRKTIMERETLLRELYHRTKNNMNTISSLINLQTASLHRDEIAIQMFRDLQDRIMSMALVHERLYKSKDLSNVKLKDYVSDLANSLMTGYKIDRNKLSLRLDIEDFTLSIDTLIPCGLIINELMTNSLKYAFADGREGQIRIKGRVSSGSEIQLVYSDNGIGFPEGFDFTRVETLGLRLINGLITSQLRGKIEIATRPETVFTFAFHEPEYQRRI
ncbi:MAG: PAS domain S-box protein [Dissulfurispiraceae bacterium]